MAPVQYIVIKQGVAAHKVPSISAQAALSSYMQWRKNSMTKAWAANTCARRIVVANPSMFARLKETSNTIVFHDVQNATEEVALVPNLENDYPEDFINLPNWYVNA